jgi:hypothetical protein
MFQNFCFCFVHALVKIWFSLAQVGSEQCWESGMQSHEFEMINLKERGLFSSMVFQREKRHAYRFQRCYESQISLQPLRQKTWVPGRNESSDLYNEKSLSQKLTLRDVIPRSCWVAAGPTPQNATAQESWAAGFTFMIVSPVLYLAKQKKKTKKKPLTGDIKHNWVNLKYSEKECRLRYWNPMLLLPTKNHKLQH